MDSALRTKDPVTRAALDTNLALAPLVGRHIESNASERHPKSHHGRRMGLWAPRASRLGNRTPGIGPSRHHKIVICQSLCFFQHPPESPTILAKGSLYVKHHPGKSGSKAAQKKKKRSAVWMGKTRYNPFCSMSMHL